MSAKEISRNTGNPCGEGATIEAIGVDIAAVEIESI